MAETIGIGLALNILLWLVGLAVACCLGVFAIMGFIPGNPDGKPKHDGGHRDGDHPASTGVTKG